MPNILYSPTAQLMQVEDFPENCERTVKGALHVRPGATAAVSDGEAAHLKRRGVPFSVLGPKVSLKPPAKPVAPTKTQPTAVSPLPSAGPITPPTGGQK